MENIIGAEAHEWQALAAGRRALHLYGKGEVAPGPQDGPHHAVIAAKTG